MHPIDEQARQATRRRVRVFVIGGLLAVLVVSFWPILGLSVDEESFLAPFKPSINGPASGHPKHHDVYNLRIHSRLSRREAEQAFFASIPSGQIIQTVSAREPALAVVAFKAGVSRLYLLFLVQNVHGVIALEWYPKGIGPGQTEIELLRARLNAILDGLNSEAPGVSRRYLPPAVQLWRDKVAPFLKKHFP